MRGDTLAIGSEAGIIAVWRFVFFLTGAGRGQDESFFGEGLVARAALSVAQDLAVFHVEHGWRHSQPIESGGCFGAGHEHLGTACQQPFEDAALMGAIEFGSQVVQRHDGPLAATLGVVLGLGLGLAIEAGLGAVGGWLYRRRVTLAVLVEFGLIVAFIGPFILVYAQSTPQNYAVCCIEDSGLGDQAETVAIAGADGETLAGWYAPPSEARGPAT